MKSNAMAIFFQSHDPGPQKVYACTSPVSESLQSWAHLCLWPGGRPLITQSRRFATFATKLASTLGALALHGRLTDSTWQMERLYNNTVNMERDPDKEENRALVELGLMSTWPLS